MCVHDTTTENGTLNRIRRFTAGGGNSDVALAGRALKLIELPTLSGATIHNGGALHFGADGKLCVGVGENAKSNLSPDLTSPFGKLLRFNDDGGIPSDNPHLNTQNGVARAIWACGLQPAQPVRLRCATGRGPHRPQRRGSEHLGRDQRRHTGRRLRLPGV